jgi:hypothetical protein
MSVSLLLVPLAVAAVAVANGARAERTADGKVICQVRTRMRDENLLGAALRATGAVVSAIGTDLQAGWDGVEASFRRDTEGIWSAHFTGAVTTERAVEIVTAIDAAYGRQVQQAVLDRIRDGAPAASLRLESENVAEDASVRLVFQVEAGR